MKSMKMIKRVVIFVLTGLSVLGLVAQPPQAFRYQTVIHDSAGNSISDQSVSFRFSILETSSTGPAIYTEEHSTMTNNFGLASLEIGNGTNVTGDFSAIDWGVDNYFLKVEVDVNGGNNFVPMGTSQLLSVPYALYAGNTPVAGWTISDDNVISTNSGNIGIGLSAPVEKLQVEGNIKTQDTLKFRGRVIPESGINNPGQILIGPTDIKLGYEQDNFGNILIGNSLFGKTVFDLTMSGTGNIGIGTDVFHETTSGYSNICLGLYTGYNLSSGSNNILIGSSAGEHMSTGLLNICLGNQSGNGRNGDRNIFLGDRAGYAWSGGGSDNIMMGNFAGYKYNATNSRSVFLGSYAGYNTNDDDNVYIGPQNTGNGASGNKNIFLGFETGRNWTGSNTLLIDNKNDNVMPFIKGDMENDLLEVNASMTVNGNVQQQSASIQSVLNLQEITEFPLNPQNGDLIYMNDTLRFYNGTGWRNIW